MGDRPGSRDLRVLPRSHRRQRDRARGRAGRRAGAGTDLAQRLISTPPKMAVAAISSLGASGVGGSEALFSKPPKIGRPLTMTCQLGGTFSSTPPKATNTSSLAFGARVARRRSTSAPPNTAVMLPPLNDWETEETSLPENTL